MLMSAKDVSVLVAMAKSTKPKSRRDAWFTAKAATNRLKQHSAGQLTLAPEVRLPLNAVVTLLWRVRKTAMSEWRAAKAADEAAALQALEDNNEESVDVVDAQLAARVGSTALFANLLHAPTSPHFGTWTAVLAKKVGCTVEQVLAVYEQRTRLERDL